MVNNQTKGLYSENHFLMDSVQSLLSGDRIFSANQPDEFGMGSIINSGNKVLVLGLGFGASLRPLIAGIDDIKITAIDNDPVSIEVCSNLVNSLFSAVRNAEPKYILGDAFKFDKYIDSLFDVICIDIYTPNKCPKEMIDPDFWKKIKKHLTSKGSVIINTWGLPMHLDPFNINTHQVKIMNLVREEFKYVKSTPTRRNITLVASRKQIECKSFKSKYQLDEIDEIYFDLFPLRLDAKYDILQKVPKIKSENTILLHHNIDIEMGRRNLELIRYLNDLTYPNLSLQNISEYIRNPKTAKNITYMLLQEDTFKASLVPNFIGSYAFNGTEGLEWYAEWIINDFEKLVNMDEYWYVNFGLWQLVTMLANPYSNLRNYSSAVRNVVSELNNGKHQRLVRRIHCEK